MGSRVTFIDSGVMEYQSLLTQLPPDTEAIVLNHEQDAVMQMLVALQGKNELDAIDIISHGKPGALLFGSGELNNANLENYAQHWEQIGRHLHAEGDLLLYGCEVAKGKIGQKFVERLSQLTGTHIAASATLTGAAELGGNWILAMHAGEIRSSTLQLFYSGVLQGFIGTSGNDVLDGTDGTDSFTGGQGNDTLNGNYGRDVAIFSGTQAGYEFSLNVSGLITVRDINAADGDEGTDTLSSIEIARFSDGDIEIKPPAEEFLVNTYTTNAQENSSITALTDGGFVVSWQSWLQDSSEWGVYAQRYDAYGTPQGSEFRVNNTYTTNQQLNPSVAALTDGGFVVSWQSELQLPDGSGYGVYAQRYDASGAPQGGEILVNTYTLNDQENPAITALTNGGFVVSWQSGAGQDGQEFGIFAQRFDANGLKQGDELPVNTFTSQSQHNPSITALTNGGFVVSWQSETQDGHGYGIYAQRYNASGEKQGVEFQVNTTTASAQTNPSITALIDGGFVVSWQSDGQDGSGSGIYAQRYDANGEAQESEFRVNTHTDNHQSNPSVTALNNGGFVVSWQSYNQDGFQGYGIYAQRYDANGVAQGGEFQINTYTPAAQSNPSITALTDGGFVVSWQSYGDRGDNGFGIYAQRYDSEGNQSGYLQLEGTANADHLKVAATLTSPVFMLGLDGHDALQGGKGSDILDGGTGNDKLNGGLGADILRGGLGNDSYVVDNAGDIVTENSAEGTDKISSKVTYTLPVNVENLTLTGSSAINATGNTQANKLTGNSGNNALSGAGGNDTLDGKGGTNTLTGGAGKDKFNFTTLGHIDTITDFVVADDTIQLDNAVFTSLITTGTLAADKFRIGTQALDANDFIIYNNVTGAILYDADGSNAGAAIQIATVGVGLTMTNTDFAVI